MVFVLTRAVLHLVTALLLMSVAFPFLSPVGRRRSIRWWARRALAIFAIDVRLVRPAGGRAAAVIDAALRPEGIGAMLVMNHVSWLDIQLVHSLRAARFVAKAEIARWPVLGYLTARSGALFIERGRRHAVRDVNHRAADLLRGGEMIGMFPEGTTGDGRRLLPFHANLIEPAIDAAVPIVVAGIRYREVGGGPTMATDYVGDTTLMQSLLRIARHGPLVAELTLIEALDGASMTRHEVARTARALIADALAFDDEGREALEDLSTVIVVPDESGVSPGRALPGTGPGTMLDPRDELL